MGLVMGAEIETDMRRDAYGYLQKLSDMYYNNIKIGQIMGYITNELFDVTEFAHRCPKIFGKIIGRMYHVDRSTQTFRYPQFR